MYLIDTLASSLHDICRNIYEREHKIARCFDEDNAQKDILSHYNRAIDLSEHRNESLSFDKEIDLFQPSSPRNNFDCVGMGVCDKSVKYTGRVTPCVSNTRVEDFNNRNNFSAGALHIFNGLKYGKNVKILAERIQLIVQTPLIIQRRCITLACHDICITPYTVYF